MTEKKRLARANGMTFKVLALVLLQFQSLQKKEEEKKKKRGYREGVESSSAHIHPSWGGVRKVENLHDQRVAEFHC